MHFLVKKSLKKRKSSSLLSAVFKPPLLLIKSLAQFVLGILLPGLKWRGVKLTADIHVILTLGMRGLLLHCPIRLHVAQFLFQHGRKE